MTVHIALDAMGGDRGPEEMVAGAVQALDYPDLEITLLGDEGLIGKALGRDAARANLHVVHASQSVEMGESPFEAVRRKKDSSIVVAFNLLKQGKVDAVVSAGNSGATMASAIIALGRLPNISRPGIASIFPTLKNPLVMMDVGANVDCRPRHLLEFGLMAAAFYQVKYGIERPIVGLLSIGEEGGKGNSLVKNAHALFQRSSLNYIGNVEGRETFLGNVDIIICDGFVGNVCLKVSEGLAEAIMAMLRVEMNNSLAAKIGYFLARRAFTAFKRKVDYTEYGGAPLLGLNGIGIVCHGRSNAKAIRNAILLAADMARKKVNEHTVNLLTRTDIKLIQEDPDPKAASQAEPAA